MAEVVFRIQEAWGSPWEGELLTTSLDDEGQEFPKQTRNPNQTSLLTSDPLDESCNPSLDLRVLSIPSLEWPLRSAVFT
jgi:hypothetical protein